MPKQQRILAVVDPTASLHPSVDRAAWLARHTGASIELYVSDYAPHLADTKSYGATAEARTALLDRHRARLDQLAAPLHSLGLTVDIDARWDYPLHDSIVRKAEQVSADIVIKDTHYHSALNRSIFSNTDWSLIRSCAATLWLVKPRPPGQKPCFIAAVDPLHERDKPADLDKRILSTARDMADALQGEVHVFHSFDVTAALAVSTDAMTMPITLPVSDLTDAMRAAHSDAVARLCSEYFIPVERTHVLQGGTRPQLVELTEKLRADAVVMGAISRSGLKGLFLGNTAEDVLDRLHCDLVIVKPEGFKTVLSG